MKKFIAILFCIIIFCIVFFLGKVVKDNKNNNFIEKNESQKTINQTAEEIVEVEEKSNNRPIAVMIDNVGDAKPQSGLNKAYLVYEITVEGRLTRLMALFKDVELDNIGPVRSARPYFLDYALENDAIFVHYGGSTQAFEDISTLNVNNINGITEDSKKFWRISGKSAPHNVMTSTEKLESIIERKGYRTTTNVQSVFNNSNKEENLENGVDAINVKIPYTSSYCVRYKYDTETKKYVRSYNNTIQKDYYTNEIVSTKNIIISYIENIDTNDSAGRQILNDVGTYDGYYITNGKAIKIVCTKESRKAQTIYKDLNGNEININNGNTFVQIVPLNTQINIE